jgi:hypothetical protein
MIAEWLRDRVVFDSTGKVLQIVAQVPALAEQSTRLGGFMIVYYDELCDALDARLAEEEEANLILKRHSFFDEERTKKALYSRNMDIGLGGVVAEVMKEELSIEYWYLLHNNGHGLWGYLQDE